MFKSKIKFLPARPQRGMPQLLQIQIYQIKVYKLFGAIQLKDYIKDIIKR